MCQVACIVHDTVPEATDAGPFRIPGRVRVAVGIGLGVGAGEKMVYFCDLGTGAWVGYFSGSGLTNCEWLIPGSGGD